MSFDLSPIGASEGPAPPSRSGPAARAGAPAEVSPAVRVDTMPAAPPSEVMDEVSTAAHVWQVLHDQGRELHFDVGADHRVRIEVRDLDGNVLRTIPPSEALSIAGGD